MESYKPHFSRFLGTNPARLHVAAHSHHPWPDVSFAAQQRAWLDAAELMDGKWERIFGEVLPAAQRHVALHLHLPDANTVCFAPNTHELVMRLLSCIPRRPIRVLTTDGEFHSFARQLARLEEDGLATAQRVAAEPFDTLTTRLAAAAAQGGHDLVYFSQCLYNSGALIENLSEAVTAVPDDETLIVIDGYHGFMAVPTDLSAIAARAFYLAGGYKYAMAGEGAAFMHCPPGYGARPVDTGWYAGFAALSHGGGEVRYSENGHRFLGATFDPSGIYRFNAAMQWLQGEELGPASIHVRVQRLQAHFLDGLATFGTGAADAGQLIPNRGRARGNFLCFRTRRAGALHDRLAAENVTTDYREDRLRLGFGIYHDTGDIAELLRRCERAFAGA